MTLASWYARAGRSFSWRFWTDPYRLSVVEVLLQRTRAETVAAFEPAFFTRFGTWRSLAAADRRDLEVFLEPIGLQVRKAAALTALADAVVRHGLDPASRDAPGVGQYTSRAIAVATRGEEVAMVDANWVRVLVRSFGGPWTSDYRYDARLQSIAQAVVRSGSDPRVVNWAVLDLGATICLPRRPRCDGCPLRPSCDYATAP